MRTSARGGRRFQQMCRFMYGIGTSSCLTVRCGVSTPTGRRRLRAISAACRSAPTGTSERHQRKRRSRLIQQVQAWQLPADTGGQRCELRGCGVGIRGCGVGIRGCGGGNGGSPAVAPTEMDSPTESITTTASLDAMGDVQGDTPLRTETVGEYLKRTRPNETYYIPPPVLLVYTPQLEVATLIGGATIRLPGRGGVPRVGVQMRGMLIPMVMGRHLVLGRLLLYRSTTLTCMRSSARPTWRTKRTKKAGTAHLRPGLFASMRLRPFTIRKRGVALQQPRLPRPRLRRHRFRRTCPIRVECGLSPTHKLRRIVGASVLTGHNTPGTGGEVTDQWRGR